MNAIVPVQIKTMTGLEIADLVNSEHRAVTLSVERLAKRNIIQLPPMVKVENKQSLSPNKFTKTYEFTGEQGKRDSIIVVAQLCPEFTARLVDRWQELEAQVAQPVFDISNPYHLLQAIETQAKQNIELTQKVEKLEPKAQALDTIAETDNTYTVREVAKTIGIQQSKLADLLVEKRWAYRDAKKKLQPHAQFVTNGVFINRPSPPVEDKKTGKQLIHLNMRVTAFGLTRITGLVNKHQGK